MRTRRFVTFRLFAALVCISAFVSCKPRLANYSFKSDRLVTIEVSPDDATKCEVDFPVAFMRIKSNKKIAWASDDNAYTVRFVSLNGVNSNATPFTSQGDIAVPVHGNSGTQTLQDLAPVGYYEYEILNAKNQVCKPADDDHDTGLNIKR